MAGGIAFKPREKRLAVGAVTVIGCWALVTWLVQPLWDRLDAIHEHVEGQRQKLAAMRRLMAQSSSLVKAREAVKAYLDEEVSPAETQASFLREVERLSSKSGLKLNLKPRRTVKSKGEVRFDVEIVIEGEQGGLFEFLDSILSIPRLIVIDRLRISRLPAKRGLLRANLALHVIGLGEI